ncbi:RNA polymerase sigma factor RpoE [Achromatium sp. WMS3]|nr:RNA polymerase sigma factor RpoE [Achromatium sp. WMS3]
MTQSPTDKILVERAQCGNRQAFDLLVLRYQYKIVNIISRLINDPDEALDVAQETFIKAYLALPGFKGQSSFYTWLYRIAVNTAKNYLTAQNRRLPRGDIDIEIAEQQIYSTKLHNYATPEREVLAMEIASTIKKALNNLPKNLRTAIILRELDGMSYEEIAEVMSSPIGTVRSRIFRAREAIDRQLRPLLES